MGKERLVFIDTCKVLAMFMVTWAHCAQQISGNMFPQLLLSKDIFISINMPIFMLASGFVINIQKIRDTSFKVFLISKSCRLLLPMTIWFFFLSIVIYPKTLNYWDAYWYLSALFICFLLIKALTYIVPSSVSVHFIFLISTMFLMLFSISFFKYSFFMMPFLWLGYFLRNMIDKIEIKMMLFLLILYGILYRFWDVSYSIYNAPFNICNIELQSFFSLIYRFLIGGIGGIVFIAFIRLIVNNIRYGVILSKYGQYTLVFYTMSFVLNAILARFIWHFNLYIFQPIILDVISFGLSACMMVLMYVSQIIVEHNRFLCLMFGVNYYDYNEYSFIHQK